MTDDPGYQAFVRRLTAPPERPAPDFEALRAKAAAGAPLYDQAAVLRRYERQRAFRRKRR